MLNIRPMAHAGSFYPAQPQILTEMLFAFYSEIDKYVDFEIYKQYKEIKAIFSPHAGYIYSGIVATAGYKVFQLNKNIDTLVLLGPAHYDAVNGWMFSNFDAYLSPLGLLEIDKDLQQLLLSKGGTEFVMYNKAHIPEHSLEVQLPFIQVFLKVKKIVPILAGIDPDINLMAKVIFDIVETNNNIGLLISTDLSHYLPYDEAIKVDSFTLKKFIDGDENIGPHQACGYAGLVTLIKLSKLLNYKRDIIMYANSGDTAGMKDQVVGYATGLIEKV